ncbi:hypothetical protein [Vibrio crassostreae]|uniref:hypothetical protein n=1 Tax=Vibrio crassostreae TaxID=246167 RepID=UPI001B302557|nr:hypothetical protein [Vibrio crassostreae]
MDRLLVDNTASTDITIYPQNMAELQAGGLIPVCSAADFQNQLCVDYTVLPWGAGAGEQIIISRRLDANGFAQATITFNVNTEQREDMRRLFRRELGKVFGYTEDAAGQVTYTIDRPSESVMLSGFVSTDGQTPMQPGSWDFGGSTTLDNVQDISFAGITDRTAITGLLKNGSVSVTNLGGVRVTKPSCPATYSPTITTYLIGLGGNTEYSEVGNFDTWYEDISSTEWSVHIRFAGLRVGQTTRAWHYVGGVGFFTWCDL